VSRPLVFTGDIFRLQPRGGITRYFAEVLPRLARPAEVVLGWHQSEEAARLGVPVRAGLRFPAVRGIHRLVAPANAWIDRFFLPRRHDCILHPTYYRDPAGLPSGRPLVLTVHDMAHERFPEMYRGHAGSPPGPERHKLALCRRADRVVCDSGATARDAIELLGLPESRIRVVPLGGREWSGVTAVPVPSPPKRFVLWVGLREAHKNFDATLAAWAACPEAAEWSLLCVGGGPLRRRERERIEALGLSGRVAQRTCSDGELRWAYEHAGLLLYTSLWEGFGLPLLEAMQLDCPVVTSDRASMPEIGGDAATYVDPTDRESLRDGIRRALAAGRLPETVARSRAQAARFSWADCAAGLEAVYRELD
jgi:glycosyltransferase involved in cell wall biosynthesis